MTPAQRATLKAFIVADPVLGQLPPLNSDSWDFMRVALNGQASPNFTVWRTNVTIRELGDSFVGTEVAGLTTANQTRLQTIAIYSAEGINAGLADRRAFFDDIFSGAGGAGTRTRLLVTYKRLASRVEKLFAAGTGSDPSPATLVIEGPISILDVQQAMES